MYFPLCFVFILFPLQKQVVTEAQSSSLVKFNSEPILWPVWKGKMQLERPGKWKGLVEENIIAYSLDNIHWLNIWWGKFVFDEIVEYFISSQISSWVSVSALVKIIPLILNLEEINFKPKRDASFCGFIPVINSGAQQ